MNEKDAQMHRDVNALGRILQESHGYSMVLAAAVDPEGSLVLKGYCSSTEGQYDILSALVLGVTEQLTDILKFKMDAERPDVLVIPDE